MEYSATFIHPTTEATLTALLDPELTADEVINALVGENFILPPGKVIKYALEIDGGQKVEGSQTLASGGLKDGGSIQILEPTVIG